MTGEGARAGRKHDPGTGPLLEIDRLAVEFRKPRSIIDVALARAPVTVRAVDGVSLNVFPGETLGLVGESGSGKTTVGRAILGLYTPTSGSIRFDGQDCAAMDAPARRRFRRQVQMVFQDPYSSLNPRITAGKAIAEVLRFHGVVGQGEVAAEVKRLLALVGMLPDMAARLPRSLSGGQRQRVGLARALAVRPRLLVLDEPVAALDVSIQAQVLNLLNELRGELGLTMLLIAHELGIVRHMSDRVAVMYLGKIMEVGTREEIFQAPRHPYTASLLQAVPRLRPVKRRRAPVLRGEVPSPLDIPSGCRFRTRCPMAQPRCAAEAPPIVRLSPSHLSACHFAQTMV